MDYRNNAKTFGMDPKNAPKMDVLYFDLTRDGDNVGLRIPAWLGGTQARVDACSTGFVDANGDEVYVGSVPIDPDLSPDELKKRPYDGVFFVHVNRSFRTPRGPFELKPEEAPTAETDGGVSATG